MKSAEILLHPVRMSIWQAFLGDRALTVSDLRAELTDVPSSSLYRQVGVLVDNGVLAVAGERPVGGATERTYVLRAAAASITDRELATMDADEHRAAFMAFLAGLLGDFDRYVERADVDLRRDGAGYRILAMWLDDEEFAEFVTELSAVLQPRLAQGPGAGRTRRLLATIMLPGGEAEADGGRPGTD